MAIGTVVQERTEWDVRYTFGPIAPEYDQGGEGKCWQMWHPDLKSGPFCQELLGHAGDHSGFAVRWSRSPRVDAKTAGRFLQMYRAIPNGQHDIILCDDGTVTMTLAAFSAATRFIGLGLSDD